MNKKIKIGNIYIDFTYQFNDYFQDELLKYLCLDGNINYHIFKVIVQEEIEAPMVKNESFRFKNRVKMSDDYETYIITYNLDKTIKHLIYYTNDYQKIIITLTSGLGERLAEYEYVLSGMLFFEIAINNNYLPIHASALKIDDYGILLSGPSKSGKSTQTKYFLEEFPESFVVNEDKPLICLEDNEVYFYGSPWSGKNVINSNQRVRLDYILFLHKSNKTDILEIEKQSKIKELMRNIHRPGDEISIDNMFFLIDNLLKKVKILDFNCVNSSLSAQVFKEYLGGLK
jgi:hypothetical protein